MVRKDYPDFDDQGRLRYVPHWEQKKPKLTYQQKQRRNNKLKIDQDRADTEIVVFGIKTRDENNDIHTKECDNNQVIRLIKELKRGSFILKTGMIVHTIRQVRNDRHPDEIPITVTLATKDLVVEILEAAQNSNLCRWRKPRKGDEEAGRVGFIRKSLSEKERKEIKERKRFNNTKIGKNQAELKRREENSRTNKDTWAYIIFDEDDDDTAIKEEATMKVSVSLGGIE